MAKRVIGLGSDGELTLRLSSGRTESLDDHVSPESSVVVLIDCSSSMSGEKLEQAKNGAWEFSREAFAKGYVLGIVQFSSAARLVCPLVGEGDDRLGQIWEMESGGTTNLTDAIDLAAQQIAELAGNRVIVIATDGYPDDRTSALRSSSRAKSSGIEIIAIGTVDADWEFLSRVATTSESALSVKNDQIAEGIVSAARLLPASTKP